ncbi:MAG: hypothetical protein M3Z59_05715 [Bombella apis]|nr:hypothetical protein [Bombella apis]
MSDLVSIIEGFYLSEMFRMDPVTGRHVAVGIIPSFMPVESFPIIFPALYAFFETPGMRGEGNRFFDFVLQSKGNTTLCRSRFRVGSTLNPSMVTFLVQGPIVIHEPGEYFCKVREIDEDGNEKSKWEIVKKISVVPRPDLGKIFQETGLQEKIQQVISDYQKNFHGK